MKGISFFHLVAIVAMLALLTACYDKNAQPKSDLQPPSASFDWTASINGSGGEVTGGTLGVQKAAPTPAPLEQLEKGNAAKVSAQVKARAILPAVPTPVRAAATPAPVFVPYINATDVRSSSDGPAWYNGFL